MKSSRQNKNHELCNTKREANFAILHRRDGPKTAEHTILFVLCDPSRLCGAVRALAGFALLVFFAAEKSSYAPIFLPRISPDFG